MSQHDSRIAILEKTVQDLQAQQHQQSQRASALQAQQFQHSQDVATIRDAVNTAVEAHQVVDPAFNRAPNRGILRISTNEAKVAKDKLEQVLHKEWLGAIFQKEQYKVEGPEEGNKWTLHFNSIPETASLQVRKARKLLQRGNGEWIDLYIGEIKVYINLDENPQCTQTSAASRTFLRAIAAKCPGRSFKIPPSHRPRYHPQRAPEAIITCDLVDIASISVASQFATPQVAWKPGGAEHFDIDKAAVVGYFEELYAQWRSPGRPDTSMWCK
eukprot:10200267-Karenia_brevis.AAC.1